MDDEESSAAEAVGRLHDLDTIARRLSVASKTVRRMLVRGELGYHQVVSSIKGIPPDQDAPPAPPKPLQEDLNRILTDFGFEIDSRSKARLLGGLDTIGETLTRSDAIAAFEASRAVRQPWLETSR